MLSSSSLLNVDWECERLLLGSAQIKGTEICEFFFSNIALKTKRNTAYRGEVVAYRKREETSQFLTQTEWRREEISENISSQFPQF
jgi:hypothetical protein